MHRAATTARAMTNHPPPSMTATPPDIAPQPTLTSHRGRSWPPLTMRRSSARPRSRSRSPLSTPRTRWSTRVRSR
ncbi:MAG: hypothetical protein CMH83_07930 [Nocardioides sp.]|nr:hypothetical protein [Nocardioides sp.]